MTRTTSTLLAVAISLAPGLLLAQAGPGQKGPKAKAPVSAGPAAPKPDAEMAQVKYFVGTWRCTGRAEESPFGPAHPTAATVHATMELGGFWLFGRYDETISAENRAPFHLAWTWGHDAKERKFYAWSFDAMGGASRQESSGWDGDKLVFSGQTSMGGQQMRARDTFTKKGENELTHVGELEMNGAWTKLDEETCTRPVSKK